MVEFAPVVTLEELDALDEDDITAGYLDGLHDHDEPGHNRGRAYWHGWRNAQMDRGRMLRDEASKALVRDYFHRLRLMVDPHAGTS